MTIWRFKACPRCGGDCFLDSDHEGWFEQCLLCGHMRELPVTVVPKAKVPVAVGVQ